MVVLAVLVVALAFLGMILGIYLLLVATLGGLVFSPGSMLVFVLIGVATGLALLGAGQLLDRRLSRDLASFLARSGPSPLRDHALTRAYALLVLSLLPFFLYLQGFALYSVVAISLDLARAVAAGGDVPLIALLIPAMIVVGTVLGVAIGLFRLFVLPAPEPIGIPLTPDQDRPLWALSRSAADYLGTRPADAILLSPEPGIGVSVPVGLLHVVFGARRTLEIGLPSICGLRVDQLAAILTHEYGHLDHRDARWATFIHALGASLSATLAAVPGPWSFGEPPTILNLIATFNPAYWTMFFFVSLFLRLIGGFSRTRETLADLEAASRLGGHTFARALLRVAVNDLVFHDLVEERDVPWLLNRGQFIDGFDGWMERIYRYELGPYGIEALEYRLIAAGQRHDPADSHPGLEERIEATARLDGAGSTDDRPVAALFDDWRRTDEALTRLYYRAHGWSLADETTMTER